MSDIEMSQVVVHEPKGVANPNQAKKARKNEPIDPTQEKKTRKNWVESEDLRLLIQCRTTVQSFTGKEVDMWKEIFQALISAGIVVSTPRSAREHCLKLITEFRQDDRIDQWRTGDPGTLTETQQVLLDIVNYQDDRKKSGKPKTVKKIQEVEKQRRKDQKFIYAATHAAKKRGLSEADLDQTDGELPDGGTSDKMGSQITPPRVRTSYNHSIQTFLGDSKEMKAKEIKMAEDKLAMQVKREERLAQESAHKMKMEEARMALDRKREKTQATTNLIMLQALSLLQKPGPSASQ